MRVVERKADTQLRVVLGYHDGALPEPEYQDSLYARRAAILVKVAPSRRYPWGHRFRRPTG